MQRSRAAERDQCELTRIDTALDRDGPHRLLHRRVDDRDHSGRVHTGPFQRGARRGDVEPAETGKRDLIVDAAQHEVGVGHGRRGAAEPVARPGPGAEPALSGPTVRAPPASMRGDRSAARADRVDVERGEADREAADAALRRGLGHPAANQAHVRARAAHVERDRVGIATRGADLGRGPHAARRPREQQRRRRLDRVRHRDETAGRSHHEHLVAELARAERGTARTRAAGTRSRRS